MTTSILENVSLTASPIGEIPMTYMRMSELCRAMCIRYNDENIWDGPGAQTHIHRNWRIISDPVSGSAGTTTNNHTKACMLQDFIQFKFRAWSRREVLDELIDKREPDTRRLMLMSRRSMYAEMVKIGVPKYESGQKGKASKRKSAQTSIEENDF